MALANVFLSNEIKRILFGDADSIVLQIVILKWCSIINDIIFMHNYSADDPALWVLILDKERQVTNFIAPCIIHLLPAHEHIILTQFYIILGFPII